MRVFVTGVNGQLGHDMLQELMRRGHEVIGSGSGRQYNGADEAAVLPYVQMDISDFDAVSRVLTELKPDAAVHCAAWTAVDAAEDEENREKVFSLNVKGPENIAKVCHAIGASMVYISTDYVFGGQGSKAWTPDQKDFAPPNIYGQSKLLGERAVEANTDRSFIVRTAWVFGVNGNNFIRTMINAGKTHESVRVVNDQIGTPTYTRDLSRLLADMLETEKYGYYHATNEGGYISWYDFCCEVYRQYGLKTEVVPVSTAEYGLSKAARPLNSRLDKTKLARMGFEPLPDWRDAVSRYLREADL